MPFTKGHKINIGRKVSNETRKKLSIANKGQIPWHKGRTNVYSEETKRKIGEGNKKALLGHKQSKETIEKRRLANFGKKRSDEFRERARQNKLGIKNPMFGKKPSIEQRKKQSEAMKKYWEPRKDIEKQKQYERIRKSLEYRLWREAVLKRDNYTCIWCGDDKGGNLEADHIKPFSLFPELRFAIDNGRTLCEDCHKKTDTWGNKVKLCQWNKLQFQKRN